MLSEINKRMINTIWFHSYMEFERKSKQVNKQNRNRVTNTESAKQVVAREWGMEERNRWMILRGTDFQLQNKWVMGMKCTAWGI